MKGKGFGWGSVVIWTVATILGWNISFFISPPPVKDSFIGADGVITLVLMVANGIAGIIGGLVVSTGQWFAIQRSQGSTPGYIHWLNATAVGLIIGGLLSAYFTPDIVFGIDLPPHEGFSGYSGLRELGGSPMLIDVLLRGAVMTACVGLIVGIAQWLVIGKWRKAGYWPLVSVLAWTLGGIVYWWVYIAVGGPLLDPYSHLPGAATDINAYDSARTSDSLIAWAAGGVVIGVLTAVAMKWLLGRQVTASHLQGET